MPQPLPRLQAELERRLDAQKLTRILLEVGEAIPDVDPSATAPGDGRRLRGLPAVAKGSSGAVPGTDPLRALIAKERRRDR